MFTGKRKPCSHMHVTCGQGMHLLVKRRFASRGHSFGKMNQKHADRWCYILHERGVIGRLEGPGDAVERIRSLNQ